MYKITLLFICFFASKVLIHSQIFIDEKFDDWNQVAMSYTDAKGDVNSSQIDIGEIKVSNDEERLFIYININKEINLQSGHHLSLAVDFDNNASTGLIINGIGAELVYDFGDRMGQLYLSGQTTFVYHNHIGLVSAPTVTSNTFELSIQRQIKISSLVANMGNIIKVSVFDDTASGDKAPNSQGLQYTFDGGLQSYSKKFAYKKASSELLRILSYNVLQDNIFDSSVTPSFKRVIAALQPDIMGFCEVYDHTAADVSTFVKSAIPNVPNWYTAEANPDIRIVSKYPITTSKSVDGNGVFVIKIENVQMVFIMTHLPCCDNETDRQKEIDKLMSFVRDIRYGISSLQVPINSPIVISGDMNLVGYSAQLNTLITGDISNNTSYGPDFKPDWDNTSLTDAQPFIPGKPFCFTWNNQFSTYPPGRLDFMFFTDSKMKLENAFVFDSALLSASEQTQLGVLKNDCTDISDHYPIIGDYNLQTSTNITESYIGNFSLSMDPLPTLQISNEYNDSNGSIIITDIMGRVTKTIPIQYGITNYQLSDYILPQNQWWIVSLRIKNQYFFKKFFY